MADYKQMSGMKSFAQNKLITCSVPFIHDEKKHIFPLQASMEEAKIKKKQDNVVL